MNLKEAFKIRKKGAESDDVIITIGNHLATEQVFQSEEEAQKAIDVGIVADKPEEANKLPEPSYQSKLYEVGSAFSH